MASAWGKLRGEIEHETLAANEETIRQVSVVGGEAVVETIGILRLTPTAATRRPTQVWRKGPAAGELVDELFLGPSDEKPGVYEKCPDFEAFAALRDEVAAMGEIAPKDLRDLNVQLTLLLLERAGYSVKVTDLPSGPAYVRGVAK
jgi:hypothetical protein